MIFFLDKDLWPKYWNKRCFENTVYIIPYGKQLKNLRFKFLSRTSYEPAYEIMVFITWRPAKAQTSLRILAVSPEHSQSRQSIRYSQTWSIETDEGSDQKSDI